MTRSIVSAVLLAGLTACDGGGGEHYGFLTMLGRDTVAVESVVRRGDTVTIDATDRFPRVRIRHAVAVLAPDHSFRHLTMEIRTPSATITKDTARFFTADFAADSLRVTVRDGGGTETHAYATDGALILPHVSQMYSLAELYLDAAIARGKAHGIQPGDSVPVLQFYPDYDLEGFPYRTGFVVHDGWVEPLKDGRVELWHGMISGVGFAKIDSGGHLTKYDGSQSTYKVDVSRLASPPDVRTIGDAFAATEKRVGVAQLSVREVTRATIGTAKFAVDYSRPMARGRQLVGNVIELDEVWRTGANAATQFSTTVPITLAGLALTPGTYTLWTLPHAQGAELIVNRETGQWGTQYDSAHDLGRAALETHTVADTVEKFTIALMPVDSRHGSLSMAWGTFRWTAPIVLR